MFPTGMASFKVNLSMIVDFVKDELSLIKRGENKLESGHVVSLQFDGAVGMMQGAVKASMRSEKHQVQVKIALLHIVL